jgi:hypothetical protein
MMVLTQLPALRLPVCSAVSVNEVEALRELYRKISRSIFKDDLIHKVRAPLTAVLIHSPRLPVAFVPIT